MRYIIFAFIASFIISYLGTELLETLPTLVKKSYQPRLFDLGFIIGLMMVFTPAIPTLFCALIIQQR